MEKRMERPARRIKIKGDQVFDAVVITLLVFVLIVVAYPLIFVISASLSDPVAVSGGQVLIFPKGLNFDSYRMVFKYSRVWSGYVNTIIYTACGTALSVAMTMSCAYALSRKNLPGRNIITFILAFTMFFSGGLIPTYLVVQGLGLTDTRAIIVLMGCVSISNLIITRTFIQNSIPFEIQESACIDGCSDIGILFRIILPLAAPILAVITLYYAVAQWNSYFNALIYLSDQGKQPLQIVLRGILIQNQTIDMSASTDELVMMADRARIAQVMKYALIVVSSVPVLVLYPFVQKFFVKGVMIGAIKG